MDAGEARRIAESWVVEEVARAPGETLGVFTHGSINGMVDGDAFPDSSDLDLAVVVAETDPVRHHPRKQSYRGLVIEAFYLPPTRLSSVESLLTDWVLGPNLAAGRRPGTSFCGSRLSIRIPSSLC